MAISKGLYAAPQGISDLMDSPSEEVIEIEIEDPEEVNIGLDGIEINLKPEKETADTFDANLAEYMDDSALQSLGMELVEDFDKDVQDRRDYNKDCNTTDEYVYVNNRSNIIIICTRSKQR